MIFHNYTGTITHKKIQFVELSNTDKTNFIRCENNSSHQVNMTVWYNKFDFKKTKTQYFTSTLTVTHAIIWQPTDLITKIHLF